MSSSLVHSLKPVPADLGCAQTHTHFLGSTGARARGLQKPPPRSLPNDLLDNVTHMVRNEVSKPIFSVENY